MENNFVTRRKIKHSDSHFDIEKLWTDENGNQVWAVIFCSEDEMTQFSQFDLKVGNHLYFERGELLDDALYAEMNNLPFPQWKSDRLAEVNEQIRLIENITPGAQDIFFGENEAVDNGLTDDRPYRAGDASGEFPF